MNQKTALATMAFVVGVVLSSSANAAIINLLTNAGFETGNFAGWTVGGTTVQAQVNTDGTPINGEDPFFEPTVQNVRSGQFAANALVRFLPLEQVFLDQTVAVVAGTTYDVGYWVGVDSINQPTYGFNDFENDILVDGLELSLTGLGLLNQGPTPADFRHVFGTFVAQQTGNVTVSYRIGGSGSGRAGFSLDDFHFATETPEPATLALLGLGLLAARRGRRAS